VKCKACETDLLLEQRWALLCPVCEAAAKALEEALDRLGKLGDEISATIKELANA